MGTGCVAGDGNSANGRARIVFGNLAAGLRVRLPAGGNCLLDRVSDLRLAGSLRRRRPPGVSCTLHPGARA